MSLVQALAVIKMILLIGLLVFVHELGHFMVARMFKIRVDRFGFGLPIGPTLFEKKIGEVTYCIHWFALIFPGGYVAFPDDDKENGLPDDSPVLFKNKPIYQRACVLVAGVTANFITAYLILLFCCAFYGKLPTGLYDVYIGNLDKVPKAELKTGIKEGDKVVSINGKEVEYSYELLLALKASKKFDGKITNEQYKKTLIAFLKKNPKLKADGIIKRGQTVKLPAAIDEEPVVLTLADIYMLKSKTKYIELSEEQKALRDKAENKTSLKLPVEISVADFVSSIADTRHPMSIVLERDNKQFAVNVYQPDITEIAFASNGVERMNKVDSVKTAFTASNTYMKWMMDSMVNTFKYLFAGRVSLDNMTSIVGVTKIGSDIIAKQGMLKAFLLTSLISLNLAILNILPIPVLDGGYLLFLLIEKIIGRPLNEKVMEIIANIFVSLLLTLMIFLVFNDICSIWIKKLY